MQLWQLNTIGVDLNSLVYKPYGITRAGGVYKRITPQVLTEYPKHYQEIKWEKVGSPAQKLKLIGV